jgi:hypothetical protein
MDNFEELKEKMIELTDRYGITLTDVPDRFKEMLLNHIDGSFEPQIDFIFKPLKSGILHELRCRAFLTIKPVKLDECRKSLLASEEYDENLANQLLQLWVDVFRIKTDFSIEELDEENFFTSADEFFKIEDVSPVLDNITPPLESEFVVNQFDAESKVVSKTSENYPAEELKDFKSFGIESQPVTEIEKEDIAVLEASVSTSPKLSQPVTTSKSAAETSGNFNKTFNGEQAKPVRKKESLDDSFKALREGKPELASRIMMNLAREGNSRAQFHLGEFYLDGTGFEKNDVKAKYWLQKAASKGSVQARAKLEELEKQKNEGGCCGCFLIIFLIFIFFNLIGSLF